MNAQRIFLGVGFSLILLLGSTLIIQAAVPAFQNPERERAQQLAEPVDFVTNEVEVPVPSELSGQVNGSAAGDEKRIESSLGKGQRFSLGEMAGGRHANPPPE